MILVTGGSGQLGTALRACLPAGRAIFLDRTRLDLDRPDSLEDALSGVGFDGLVNCAAYTAVDAAEEDEERATRVNGVAVGVLAGIAARRGARFVTFSTDYVFDGCAARPYVESDVTAPVNAYGRSKLAGERAALAAHPQALVVRTSWLVSATHRSFLTAILERARDGTIDVVDDQRGRPTLADDLAAAVVALLGTPVAGILHLTNRGAASWYELARAAVEHAGLGAERVRPCDSSRFPRPARRPAYSVLGSERRHEPGVPGLPTWRAGLPTTIDRLTERPPR